MVLPEFPTVQRAAHDLLFHHHGIGKLEKAPPLYSLDLKLQTLDPNTLSSYYSNKTIIKNIQLILRYMFTVAHQNKFAISHENGQILANRAIINKVTILYCRIPSQSIVGKRSAGITYQSQHCLVTNIILARFLSQRVDKKEDRYGLLKEASKADGALVGFLLNACNQSDGGKFYDPTKDKTLMDAWTSVFRYLDRFISWKSAYKSTISPPPFVTMTRTLMEMINKIDLEIIPLNLVNRMDCCAIMLECGQRKPIPQAYPYGSTMSMKHPCDAYLRSLMGHPSTLDLRIYGVHDKLAKNTHGYEESRVDPLTMYVTSRRYHTTSPNGEYEPDKKPTFYGGLPYTANESAIHSMYCGGMATVSSGYDPLCKTIMPLVSSYPCKWFPAVQFGLKDAQDHAFWRQVEGAIDNKLYGLVDSSLVIIRYNFVSCFNSTEKKSSKSLLHPAWCGSKHSEDMAKFVEFSENCKKFMRGPVLSCAKRYNVDSDILSSWLAEETSMTSFTEKPEEEKASRIIVAALQCMEKCASVLKNAHETKRQNNFKDILAINGGYVPSLRLLLFTRVIQGVKEHPFKDFIDQNTLSLTMHAPMFLSDESCKEFMIGSIEAGYPCLLPLTKKWMGKCTDIPSRICSWIMEDMMMKGTGDIGTPETLAASLPFLDKISIVCSLACAFLRAMLEGPMLEESWSLLRDGIDLEVYEWDDTFVKRLTNGASIDLEKILRSPISDEVEDMYGVVRGYVSGILYSAMMTGSYPLYHESRKQVMLSLGEKVTLEKLERFDSILKNTHLHEMGMWYWSHAKVYGPLYEALASY